MLSLNTLIGVFYVAFSVAMFVWQHVRTRELVADLELSGARRRGLETEVTSLEGQLKRVEATQLTLEDALRRRTEECLRLRAKRDQVELRADRAEASLEGVRRQHEAMAERLQVSETARSRLVGEINERQALCEGWMSEREQLLDELQRARRDLAEAERTLEGLAWSVGGEPIQPPPLRLVT
ncbi:MAG: hypothetical protein H6739_29590 [Alphaproteobacteria bacterium]|nr:hypothetical protein [Alphaproteobacteria bacterium]